MNRSSGFRSSGFVLVSVLLLCVMLVSSAVAFAWFVKGQTRAVTQDKAVLQARSVAYVMAREAVRGLKLDKNNYDSPREIWFQKMVVPLGDLGMVELDLTPLDDKIPLGKLFLPDGVTLRNELKEVWERLWQELGRRELAPKLLDYIDKDTRPRLGGYESEDNLNRAPFDISELLGMNDVTPEMLNGLADYVTMWSGSKININVAPARVLSVLNGLNERLAEEIVALRLRKEIKDLDDLKAIPNFPPRAIPMLMNMVGFTSSYFNLKIKIFATAGSSVRYFDIIIEKSSGNIVRWEEK